MPVPVNRAFIVTLIAGVFRPRLDPGPANIYSNGHGIDNFNEYLALTVTSIHFCSASNCAPMLIESYSIFLYLSTTLLLLFILKYTSLSITYFFSKKSLIADTGAPLFIPVSITK